MRLRSLNSPKYWRIRPARPLIVDPLTEITASMRIRSVLLDRIEATAPWSLHSTCGPEIKFASVLRGTGTLKIPPHAAEVPLASGDVFVLLEGADFVISDGTAAEPIESSQLND